MRLRAVRRWAGVVLLASCGAAQAESNFIAGAGAAAAARLDFTVIVPRVLFLQVGTGTIAANNTAIDLVTFAPTGLQMLTANNINATTNGTVTVRVAGNSGTVTLSAAAAGQLNNGAGANMPWTEIAVTAAQVGAPAAGFTSPVGGVAHPTLNAAGGTTVPVTVGAANTAVRLEGSWTFRFVNSTFYPAGTYGGAGPASPNNTGTNNGRLVYQAAMP